MSKGAIIEATREVIQDLGIQGDVLYVEQEVDKAASWKVGFTADIPHITIEYSSGDAFEDLLYRIRKKLAPLAQR